MRNKRTAAWLFAAAPFVMFLIAETVTGNLLSITPAGWLLNLAVYYLLYLGVFVLFGTTRGPWPVLTVVLYILAVAEYFVISFRERPIMIWDVLALRTAMTVSANYRYTVTPRLVLTFLAAVCLGAASWKRPLRLRTRKKKDGDACEETPGLRAGKAGAIWLGSFVGFFALLFGVLSPALRLDVHMWDPIISFEKEGFLLSTVLSVKTLFPQKPEGYSKEAAEALLAELDGGQTEGGAAESDGAAGTGGLAEVDGAAEPGGLAKSSEPGTVTPVNVICIMNESFADLRLYNALNEETGFETDSEYLTYFDSLEKNTQKGDLYVPVFGAMTPNSEYEFLTGNSCALAPQGSIPYQFYTRAGDDSLARIFGEQGYRTVAMHPYPGYNWNRTEAYENLGFDIFLDQDYFDELEQEMEFTKPRGYLSDRSNYDGIIRQVEEKSPGEKLFLFNVTMQNHGGYEVDGLNADIHVSKLNGQECTGEYPKADQYLTLIRMSDEALEYLLSYFEDYPEPTMIVMFGDHQPSVETPFFEALYGMRWSAVPDSLKLNSFRTPYLVWTNYDREASDAGAMSAFMLGNLVLQEAGITPSGYRACVESVRENYQAVHAMGTLDRDGSFTSILETGNPDMFPGIGELHMLQYYRMFEKQ